MTDAVPAIPAPLAPLKAAVAERTKLPPDVVETTLSEIGVTEERASRHADHLTIRKLTFSGTKRASGYEDGPYTFEWDNLSAGLFAALSEGTNQIGKSTVIEVMLWALRGRPRSLKPEVRAWIDTVDMEFAIGPDRYLVSFTDFDGTPRGQLVMLIPAPSRVLDTFESNDAFETLMGDMMMERFALQPIPNVSHTGDEASQYFHSWSAYAASMFIEGSHPAILGDVTVGALWWRMLHLFVGMPYAATHMALRNAVTLEQAKKESRALSKQPDHTADITRVEAELVRLNEQLQTWSASTISVADLDRLSGEHASLLRELTRLQERAAAADRTAATLKSERDEARAVLRRLREGASSKRAFAGLKPVCCPRCAESFPNSRAIAEEAAGRCAVCDRETLHDDQEALQEAIEAAASRAGDLASAEIDARGQAKALDKSIEAAQSRREEISAKIQTSKDQNEAILKRRKVEEQILKQTGALEQLKTLSDARPEQQGRPPREERLSILQASEAIAEARMKSASAELFDELEQEVVSIAKRVGFHGLDAITIRGNGITLTVSGVSSSYGKQTAGQRLRLRIALVMAMMRLAHRSGFGHHPGLLFIDSPGSEELSDADLLAMMKEIGQVATETANLQIFLVSARGDLLAPAVTADNLKTPLPSGTMF